MKNLLKALVLSLSTLLFSGCMEDEVKTLVTFHIGSGANILPQSIARDIVELPGSGHRLMCNNHPFLYGGDLERVDVARVDMPDVISIDGFYFRCSIDGTRKLLAASAANLNNFIVLKINDVPMGLRKIDTIIHDGMLFVIADVPPKTELQKIADDINESILTINKIR